MDSAVFYKAMAAFCRQHARLKEEDERFWLAEAEAWTELLKDRNAFWHRFADKPFRQSPIHLPRFTSDASRRS
jgi:hypothetical protein